MTTDPRRPEDRAETEGALARIDSAIEEWEAGPDAASWAADGSHEHDPAWWTTRDMGNEGLYGTAMERWHASYTVRDPNAEEVREIIDLARPIVVQVNLIIDGFVEALAEAFRSIQITFGQAWSRRDGYSVTSIEVDETHEVDLSLVRDTEYVARLFDVPEELVVSRVPRVNEIRIPRPIPFGGDLETIVAEHERRETARLRLMEGVHSPHRSRGHRHP